MEREREGVFFFKWAFIYSRTVLLGTEKIGENSPFGIGGDDEGQWVPLGAVVSSQFRWRLGEIGRAHV